MPWRRILASSLVVVAGLAVVEAALGDHDGVAACAGYGGLFGIIHGVWLFVRWRGRRAPAALDRLGTVILAVTLGALAAVTVGNLAVLTLAVPAHATASSATLGAASMWMVLVGVLCWRVWLVRSARRAAVLQLAAVTLALPLLIRAMGTHSRPAVRDSAVATVGTSPLIAFAVVLCTGPVLDAVFSRVADQAPAA